MKTTYIPGRWLAICDVCALRHYNTDLRKDWRGLMVCQQDFESRHPQDFLRVRADNPAVPWTRPESLDSFRHSEGYRDTVYIQDNSTANTQNYIDPTYFLEDYMASDFLIVVTFNRTFTDLTALTDSYTALLDKGVSDTTTLSDNVTTLLELIRTFADTTTTSDEGSIVLFDYVDSTYFAEDYVGSITTFT